MKTHLWIIGLALTAGCAGAATGTGGGTASGGGRATIGQECRADYGTTDPARSYTAFMEAAIAFSSAAGDIDGGLRESCRALGSDIGMATAEVEQQGVTTLAVCNQVAARLKTEVDAARAAQVQVRLETTDPVCVTRVDEYRRCIEHCDTRVVSAGRVEYQCQGGELRGTCSAQCTGGCAASAQGSCSGACEGTCSGGCTGVCDGFCEGQCSAVDASGRCIGSCSGVCHGSCSSGCQGTCSGQCVASAQATCQGECRGGCTVELERPVCTGRIVPPEVRTECRESCDTVQISRRECTPGETRLIVDGTAAAAAAERLRVIGAAVARRMPAIHALGYRMNELQSAGERLVRSSAGFVQVVAKLGGNAMLCAGQAAAALPRALGQVSVAFQVSVTITASVDASAR